MMEHPLSRVIEETPRYYIGVGTLPGEQLETYMAVSKEHGVIEYANTAIYYIKEWVKQIEHAMSAELVGFPPPYEPPDGQIN